jgi:hypothetical protein
MKQGFQMSDNAMMLLNDAEKSLNRAIDNMRKFAETHSGATAKYQVATTTFQTEKIVKDLNGIIKKART